MPNNAVFNSFSTAATTCFRNYLWILLLIALFRCGSAKTHSGILLPSQLHDGSLPRLAPSCPVPNPNLYYRPVIGILSHPGDGASNHLSDVSYIAASYVKFVESAGARVIPLIYNELLKKLLKKLELVNGGWANCGLYFETVGRIFIRKVLEKNDGGDHFPLYATCLGFELLTMIISEDNNILEEFSATNQAITLHFMENANIDGTVFQRFPPDLLKKMSSECLVMQNHHVYVSTVCSWNYPVTGFQWHPEKNAFEWGSLRIPHTEDVIRVTQYAANYLVSEARKSKIRPVAQEALDNLIYNYSPIYVGKAGSEQILLGVIVATSKCHSCYAQ